MFIVNDGPPISQEQPSNTVFSFTVKESSPETVHRDCNPCYLVKPASSFHDLLLAGLPSLRQQAMALTRNRADADDLVQASVANALVAEGSFEIGTNFKAWITRILRNRFLSNIRVRREHVELDEAPLDQLGRSGGQEDHVAVQDLRRLLARLPADQRHSLLLVSVYGLSYDQASAHLGVPVGTLKCRVFRARAQLRLWESGIRAATAPAKKSVKSSAKPARPKLQNPSLSDCVE